MIITKSWSILAIIAIHSVEARAITNATTYQVSLIQDELCPLLFYYDNETSQCECLSSLFNTYETVVMCANERALLSYNFCMTYKEEISTVSVSFCSYFELSDHNVSEPGFISLPNNISELNDYMCGPMNRKGIVCSECIDGYGPSVTSPKFRCSDCANAWYGVPLYLLLELVPVTVFYMIVLIFQLNITSAPMTSFIFYSNIILITVNFNAVNLDQIPGLETIFVLSYGIWSLDFFRYAIPPFCISPNLEIIHVIYLQSVSTIFPFILITITWICIKLHSRDYKIVVWPWQLLNRVFFKHINVKWNSSRTIVDAFATFFLLSFSKVTLILLLPLYPLRIYNLNNVDLSSSVTTHSFTDPSVDFISKEHLPFVSVSIVIFLFTVLLPVVLLALYPIQAFRSLLFKCLPKRSIGPLNIFVEKFYSCYRDGLDGGRDMRSLASLYFFVVLLGYILWSIESVYFLIATLFGGCSLFIANIQPYKKKYMSVIDSLILANMALLSAALDRNFYASPFFQIIVGISVLIPVLGLFSFVVYKLLKKPLKTVFILIKPTLPRVRSQLLLICCNGHKSDRARDEEQGSTNSDRDEIQLPDRIVHPELYT